MRAIIVALLGLGATGMARADAPKYPDFEAQVMLANVMVTVAGQAVSCGLRDPEWGDEIVGRYTVRLIVSAMEAGEPKLYDRRVAAGNRVLDAAIERGKHPDAAQCRNLVLHPDMLTKLEIEAAQ